MRNKELKMLLKDIEIKAKMAITNHELLNSVKLAVEYGKPIKFDFKIHTSVAIISILTLITMAAMMIAELEVFLDDKYVYAIMAISTILITTSVYVILSSENLISEISEYIGTKDTLQDNNITSQSTSHNGIQNHENLKNEFQEFDRGNYSRDFKRSSLISKDGKPINKDFNMYKFHYVDQYTVPVTTTTIGANGSVTTTTRMETRYSHYDRYGIIYQFENTKDIKILTDKKPENEVDYNSSSIEFSDTFKIGAKNELEASKFLKPVVVETILELNKLLNGLNIEINKNGLMCLSFGNDDLIKFKNEYNLSQPELFLKELSGKSELTKLLKVLSCINKLEKHLDNNFKK